jgi:tetratricopeptide (TPR) repeat protein/energy-coupling factor transporter ATP-binding protein EcfA2
MSAISGSPVVDEPAPSARSEAAAPGDSVLSASRPFPGLRPFAFADRGFFFGRESHVFALYRLVENGRFIAVIGGSGSGKSSLVLAGLCGLLDEETQDPNGPRWICLDMKPGGAPIKRLAGVLARLSKHDSEEDYARLCARIDYRLRQSSFSLESAIDEAGGLAGQHLLLIVDQFEELFRFGLATSGQRGTSLADVKARDEATQFVEILQDAERRRLENVHVLVTMRSDFIGDCAYFHRLPEVVSATQYLVPNLTRGQLAEAIREPIEKAGGAIEPELVEMLINDCGDELDQLPVLQHCLMRLWDRAGGESATGTPRLTRQTYDEIGRMTEALSRHADETLRACVRQELAVEQAFRALSEFDREGRAIRRALRFDRLLAETGVTEFDLRAILDRFRAPTCSFLVPPPSVAQTLGADDRVDIGHEALLRRWKKISGDADGGAAKAGLPASGWLGEEQRDGQRYRTLVSLVDGEGVLSDPEEKKRWWDRRPRTAAWADRYGGRFESVKNLIDDTVKAKKRSRRTWVLGAVLCVAFLLMAMRHEQVRKEEILRQEELAKEDIDKSTMTSAKTLLEDVLKAYDDKNLDLAGAESLAKISGQFLDNVRKSSKTSAADLLWAQALNVDADLETDLHENKKALALAKQAKDAASSQTQSNPRPQEPLQVLYDSTIRVGNALAAMGKANDQEALQEYNQAVEVAGKIASLKDHEVGQKNDHEVGQNDIIDAHIKIGDIYKGLKMSASALSEYQSGLEACDDALRKHPDSFELKRNEGKTFSRIADLKLEDNALDEAREFYKKAYEVQDELVPRNAREAGGSHEAPDSSLKSNLAATYTHWGLLEEKAGNLSLALSKLQAGVALDEELVRDEPGNQRWEDYAAPNYNRIADIFEKLNRPQDALPYYQKLFDARRVLAFRGLGPPKAQEEFAEAAKLLGDHSSGLVQIDAYRAATRIWKRLIEDKESASLAAQQFDVILRFAQVFRGEKDWPDAQTAYQTAKEVADMNHVKYPLDSSWYDKAKAAERSAAEAENAARGALTDAKAR